jgi:hypothetical protein
MVEETECAWLDREHRCLARRRFFGRQPRQHGYGNDTHAPKSGRAAGGHATSPDLCLVRRHDTPHAAGIVDRAMGREPVAMSLFSGGRGAATTAHLITHNWSSLFPIGQQPLMARRVSCDPWVVPQESEGFLPWELRRQDAKY